MQERFKEGGKFLKVNRMQVSYAAQPNVRLFWVGLAGPIGADGVVLRTGPAFLAKRVC
jgi:hypothetical protein